MHYTYIPRLNSFLLKQSKRRVQELEVSKTQGGRGVIIKLVLNVQLFECSPCIIHGPKNPEKVTFESESVENERYEDYRKNEI